MTLGERIADTRKKRGLSQDELAKIVGVSRQMMHQYETDVSDPRLFIFCCICDALKVPLEYLARGNGENEI